MSPATPVGTTDETDLGTVAGLSEIISYQKTIGNNVSLVEAFDLAAGDLFEQIEWKGDMTDEYFDEVFSICKKSILKTQTDDISINASYIYENSPDHVDPNVFDAIADPP